MTYEFRPTLTRSYLLQHVSEEEIFEAFGEPYGLRVQHGTFTSPLRTDRSPTCTFYRSKSGKLYLKDWKPGSFHGDCFDFVSQVSRTNNFDATLRKVAIRFGLLPGENVQVERVPLQHPVQIERQSCQIRVTRRSWNDRDREFWGLWDFKGETLYTYHVAPVERVWVDNSLVYTYNKQLDVAYVYHFGDYDYKVYFPRREKHRFLHNNADIVQGYLQLPPTGDFCVVTKSLKDIMKLYEFDIPAVAPMSESQTLTNDMYSDLRQRFTRLFCLYDNDMAGKRASVRMRNTHEYTMLMFPKGYPKDFTDFYLKRGRESTLSLIETIKSQLL